MIEEYTQYLLGLQLRHISPPEITSYANRLKNGVRNSLPPREMWPNLPPTLWVIDQLREYLDRAVILTSIYRSPAYNAQCPGAGKQSWHMKNCAVDFQVAGLEPTVYHAALTRMRAAGSFRGGLGLYKTFVHIDTRGENADWP